MGTVITLGILGILVLYLGIFKAKNALLPVTLAGLALALGFAVVDWQNGGTAEPMYNGMVVFDRFALSFTMLCIAVTALLLLFSREYFRNISGNVAEYYCLLLFSLTGAVLVNSYHNFAMLFIGIEIMSVALYVLVGIRKRDFASNEAALKYFLMGAFSTGFLLFGIALLYGATGTFDLEGLKAYVSSGAEISPLFYAGVLLLLAGLCFKVGAAPFHFWTPDVYEGAPTLVTLFMSTVVKVASFAGFLRLFGTVMQPLADFWQPVVLTIIIITLFVGNITALVQSSFKRMLAYSSISHAGYMLFAIVALGERSADSILTYATAYSLASVIAFGGLMLVRRQMGSDQFESFNGLAKRHPLLAAVLTLAMLSLAGIPLTAGFVGKFMMFNNAMGAYNVTLLLLAVVNAAIGVYYYLHVVVNMYFRPADGTATDSWKVPANYAFVLVLAAILTVAIGVWPDLLAGMV